MYYTDKFYLKQELEELKDKPIEEQLKGLYNIIIQIIEHIPEIHSGDEE